MAPSGHTPDGATRPAAVAWHRLLLASAVVIYAAGFSFWYPTAFSVTDEAHYVAGALSLARFPWARSLDTFTAASMAGESPVMYPVGTALLQAPFVAVLGWRAAALASVLSLAVVTACLYRWLLEAGKSPAAVWLWLGFPPVFVLGRLAMSDLPGAAVVAVGLYAFWRGTAGGATWRPWLAAGLATGGSLLVREPLVLILGPFAAGAMIRRDRHWPVLVVGVVAGGLARLVAGQAIYGNPFAFNAVGFGFSLEAVRTTAPFFALCLLVLIPGAAVWMPAYRGWRAPECHVATWGTVLFFLFYNYAAVAGGDLRRLVLVGRFLVPLLPLLVWCAASVLGDWRNRRQGRPAGAEVLVAWVWAGAVLAAACLVHPVVARWDRVQARIAARVDATLAEDAVVLAVAADVTRYVRPDLGRRRLLAADAAPPEVVRSLVAGGHPVFLLAVERSEGVYDEELSAAAREYRVGLGATCGVAPVAEEEVAPGTRLRVHRVDGCGPGAALSP